MTDRRSDADPRRPRFGLLAVLVAVALVVGVALMIYAVRRSGGWFLEAPSAVEVNPARSAGYDPPQPAALTASAAIDPAVLAARESGLAAQLSALETRTAAIALDAQGAAGQAGRAEMMMIAAAVRRAVERGAPLGYLEDQLRARFGATQPRAVTALTQSSRRPVTLEDLRLKFDARAGTLASGGDSDWLSSLSRELRTLVVLHDETIPSPLPSQRVARARRLLDAGRVDVAIAEVERLPGAAQAAAWIVSAKRFVRTREALDQIESAAVTAPAPAPVVLAPASTAASTPPIPVPSPVSR